MKGMQESQLCDVWSFRLLPAFAMRAYLSHHRQIAETMSQNKPFSLFRLFGSGAFCHSNRKLTCTALMYSIAIIPSMVPMEFQMGFGHCSGQGYNRGPTQC